MEINPKAPVRVKMEVQIDAPVALVWQVLSDIRGWPEWNPAVTLNSMLGEFEPGTEFHWKADGVTIVSHLQEIESQKRLLWSGRLPGLRATHLWALEQQGEKTRVITEESFEGLLARLLSGTFTRMLQNSLGQWLDCLKDECEERVQERE